MKNLVIRAISGAAFVAIMVASIIFLPSYWFGAIFFVIMLLALREFYQLSDKLQDVNIDKWMSMAGGVVLFAAAFMVTFLHKKTSLFSAYFLCLAVMFAFELFRKKGNPLMNLAVSVMGHVYVAVPFCMYCMVEGRSEQSKYLLLAFFIMIWASDTGAYLVGRFLGKHKMFERISPKKTWEGFAGGLLFAFLTGYVFHRLEVIDSLHIAFWLSMSGCVFVFGVLGDLVESMFKRTLDVKDSGNLIPGHGGLLDRFDSALLAAPVLYLLFSIIA